MTATDGESHIRMPKKENQMNSEWAGANLEGHQYSYLLSPQLHYRIGRQGRDLTRLHHVGPRRWENVSKPEGGKAGFRQSTEIEE